MASHGIGSIGEPLTGSAISAHCSRELAGWALDGKRVLMLVPDHTRTCPMHLLFPLLYSELAPRVECVTVLVALGTHPPLTTEQLYALVGITKAEHESKYSKARFFNHLWKEPGRLVNIGRLTSQQVAEITGGLLEMDVDVTCNRMAVEHDVIIMVGPVFPHEVAGFSGGNKYVMPGIAGQGIIDFFHWLGALITSPVIIGNKWTAVRRIIDAAAALLPVERKAVCMVVTGDGVMGLYCGTPEEAWSAAADLSRQVHIEYRARQYHTVLSCAPRMYDDLWTGGKCMYKVEPVVADGGRVIIYAPHIKEISPVHGAVLRETGYHTRDFFRKQWEKYSKYPWGVLAHSTHVKGVGTYENGVEKSRVEVVLATGIPEKICRKVNLGYMNPAAIKISDFEGREEDGILCVRRAGEILYQIGGANDNSISS